MLHLHSTNNVHLYNSHTHMWITPDVFIAAELTLRFLLTCVATMCNLSWVVGLPLMIDEEYMSKWPSNIELDVALFPSIHLVVLWYLRYELKLLIWSDRSTSRSTNHCAWWPARVTNAIKYLGTMRYEWYVMRISDIYVSLFAVFLGIGITWTGNYCQIWLFHMQ